MLKPIRRVVTGHDDQGRSIVLSDAQTTTHDIGPGRMTLFDVWSVPSLPATIEATQPDPTAIPSGCRFHPRCPLRPTLPEDAQQRCLTDVPVLGTGAGGREVACLHVDQTHTEPVAPLDASEVHR